jgi:hypothetical protein
VDRPADIGDGGPYPLGELGEQRLGLRVVGEAVASGL